MSTTTIYLPSPWSDVKVNLPSDLTLDQLMNFRPFKDWLITVHQSFKLQQEERTHRFHTRGERYSLRCVTIDSMDWFNKSKFTGFLKMKAEVRNETENTTLPGIVFMRGGSVAVLMIVTSEDDEDERLVIMTQQPRIPAGSLQFFEIPAGMIDESNTFSGAAAKEIREETGLAVQEEDLINMTEKALANAESSEGHLKKAMYPSPGGSDEFITLFLWERTMARMEINELKDKLAGVDKEKITVKLVNYGELWKEGARDAKTLAAWALYEGLSRAGTLYT